ncbi:MAG: hypothetical protein ACKPEN_17830 [Planktothrix sp.]|uniref:hypothetical protein n=1 Tax=Planktothrix sp. TaxID=3088171 RepID=UPI0038D50582
MAWMGARSNVAAITALNVTDLQDNIVFAATSELKFLLLQKTSTATADNSTVWAATPSGRWHLVGGNNSVIELANLAALKALTTASQDRFYILNTTPPVIYNWDAQSTATADDNLIVKLTSVTTGRMYKIYPSGASTIVSASAPTTVLASGTIYVWTENTSGTKPADADGNYPNSTITYVSNGTIWKTINACKIHYLGSPTSAGKLPNDIQEEWVDLNSGGYRYGVTNQSSSTLTWEII